MHRDQDEAAGRCGPDGRMARFSSYLLASCRRKMVTRTSRLALAFVLGSAAIAAGLAIHRGTDAADKQPAAIESKIVGWDEARVHTADWGQMRSYFTGETSGSKSVLTAVAVIEPGKSVHKAHRHAEEEYLALVEGSGTWSLNGKESPAKRGDILYAAPWIYHGLTNTGDKPLIFLVVRYTSKGVPAPPRPDNRPDEL
jgi:mannose-6-phosphate isomerase-like protein (cupin superfamily)